jgi:tetratricopeptide (TPR) repeat protein
MNEHTTSSLKKGRRWCLTLAGIFLAASGVVVGGVWGWQRHQFRAGTMALRQLQFGAAKEHFERYLMLWNEYAPAQLLAAQAARRQGDREAARRHVDACERLQGITPASALERALARAEAGDLDAIEAPLRVRLSSGDPDAVAIQEALAQGYLATQRIPEALPLLDDLCHSLPAHPRAFAWRAQARAAQSEWAEAACDARRAVDQDPACAEGRRWLALALEHLGRPREAVAQYEWFQRHGQAHADALLGEARCRQDLAELDVARGLLDALLAEMPAHEGAWVERGRLALREGDAEGAHACFRRAITRGPRNSDAYRLLALCLETEGRADEATAVVAQLHELEVVAGRLERLRRAITANARETAPRLELGVLLLRDGQEAEGLRALASVLEIDPHHEGARTALADYQRRTGRGRVRELTP